jgi:hypothetical protein
MKDTDKKKSTTPDKHKGTNSSTGEASSDRKHTSPDVRTVEKTRKGSEEFKKKKPLKPDKSKEKKDLKSSNETSAEPPTISVNTPGN